MGSYTKKRLAGEGDVSGGRNPADLGRVLLATVAFLALPLLVAIVAELASDFASNVRLEYFEVLAEGVLPILLVSSVVEWALLADRRLIPQASLSRQLEVRLGSAAYGVLFLAGEGLALYAVATGSVTTFLVVAVALIAAELIIDLVFNVGIRISGAAGPVAAGAAEPLKAPLLDAERGVSSSTLALREDSEDGF